MLMEERQKDIAELLKKRGLVTIAELTERYGISSESARRDLRILSQQGLCRRTHGGAFLTTQVGMRPPHDRNFDELPVFENYDAIAKKAATYIKANDTVYLTGGSFGYIMLRYLPKDFHYTLVVNSIEIANRLRSMNNVDIYVVGGKMRQNGSVVDSMAVDFISRMHFDLSFITGGGLTAAFGLSNVTDEVASFQRRVIENSRKSILLMPSQKVSVDSFIKVCDIEKFHILITDWDSVEDELQRVEEKGTEVIIVEQEKEHDRNDKRTES